MREQSLVSNHKESFPLAISERGRERYVCVSRDRFRDVVFSPSGIRMNITGSEGEEVKLTALQPTSDSDGADWLVLVKRVVCLS